MQSLASRELPGNDLQGGDATESEDAARFGLLVAKHGPEMIAELLGEPVSLPAPAEVAAECVPKPQLREPALDGPVGEWVRLIEPHTEASAAALLFACLVAVGALIGRSPSVTLDGARHGVNLFALLIGATSSARKGTAVARVRRLLRELDSDFAAQNVASGLSSGQGVIHHVRDPRHSSDGAKVFDAGVSDKRLLIVESEMGGALRQARGRENTLTAVLREAWDGYSLRTLTKGDPLTATDPHISIIGQITPDELRALLDRTDFANGFLNRFLLAHTERARLLPFGSDPDPRDESAAVERLRAAVYTARQRSNVDALTPAAREWWRAEYPRLTAGKSGRVGAATQRAAAQVRRVGLLFAVLDGSCELDVSHLEAAGAVWEYAEQSARYVFGTVELSARAQKVARALLDAGAGGLDRTAIRENVLRSNAVSAAELDALSAELSDAGILNVAEVKTGHRPREVWTHRRLGELGGYASSGGKSPFSPNLLRGYESDERAAIEAGL